MVPLHLSLRRITSHTRVWCSAWYRYVCLYRYLCMMQCMAYLCILYPIAYPHLPPLPPCRSPLHPPLYLLTRLNKYIARRFDSPLPMHVLPLPCPTPLSHLPKAAQDAMARLDRILALQPGAARKFLLFLQLQKSSAEKT